MTDGIKAGEGEYVDPNWPGTETDGVPGVPSGAFEQEAQRAAAAEKAEEEAEKE